MGDKACETNKLLDYGTDHNIHPVIPPTRRRKILCDYDKTRYRLRHLAENAFLKLNQWCDIATRYAQTPSSLTSLLLVASGPSRGRRFNVFNSNFASNARTPKITASTSLFVSMFY